MIIVIDRLEKWIIRLMYFFKKIVNETILAETIRELLYQRQEIILQIEKLRRYNTGDPKAFSLQTEREKLTYRFQQKLCEILQSGRPEGQKYVREILAEYPIDRDAVMAFVYAGKSLNKPKEIDLIEV